ncbi:MAG: ATP-grasp domain-containing protein [Candidatus Nanoarchaeia archaeon]
MPVLKKIESRTPKDVSLESVSNLYFPQSYFQNQDSSVIDHRTQLKRFPNQYSAWQRGLVIGRSELDVCVFDERAPIDEDYMNYLTERGLGTQLVTSGDSQKLDFKRFEFKPKNNLNAYLGNKFNFLEFCRKHGITVDDYSKYKKDELSSQTLEGIIERFGDSIIIRHVEGSGGRGIYVYRRGENPLELFEKMNSDEDSTNYVVQRFYDDVTSPSIIGVSDVNGARILNNTEQLIENNAYEGTTLNLELDNPQLLQEGQKLARALSQEGYDGAFGGDFIRTPDGRILPIELNARVTAAYYPHEVLYRLNERGEDLTSISYVQYVPVSRNYSSFGEFKKSKDFARLTEKYGDDSLMLQPGLLSAQTPYISVIIPK